ncbi:DeoR/GlpR family DNA-binding transcription regulator [Thermoflexus hugenholtzii]|uniref:Transcriptional regulator, DeoR family n=1 Tax=Thermoflexus hugenholtzii JAD2 TaxID=877466 RepID=A0A212QXE5_9CHLR|nr:DeoR/GlpR family DNA-binding transcription regulator [Thermoflexus hugenholtzii]SNB64379.1 transcriptional regulator, DeoR family [Thermoflexus hugenholtzii JAD2]
MRYPYERRQAILRILEAEGRVSVADLSRRFALSEVTIRKDLAWLEAQGLLIRTHGGALPADRNPVELAFEVRERLNREEKIRIGQAAASLVQDGDSIALDASTTAMYLARFLRDRRELTVLTNGIRVAMEFAGRPGITVLMPGGMLRWEAFSLVGTWGEDLLRRMHIHKAFVGAKGLTLEEGLTDVNPEEVRLKQAIVETAKEVIAILDHTKWGRVAFATFCPLERIRLVITDVQAPPELVEAVRRRGVEVWQV